MYEHGVRSLYTENDAEAVRWYPELAAEQGRVKAQYSLAYPQCMPKEQESCQE